MDEKKFDATWRALADPTRRTILDMLRDGPKTTGTLTDSFDISRFGVMKHLGVLEDANLVVVRREGRVRWNHLNAVPLQRIHERWVSQYQSKWASSLLGLQRVAETSGENRMENSFHIEQEITINAPIERVFEALTTDISKWWAFRVAGDDIEIFLEPEIGGRFYESNKAGTMGSLWGTVIGIEAPTMLRLSGALGVSTPAICVFQYTLEEDGGSTKLSVSDKSMGDFPASLEKDRTGGWQLLLGRNLKAYLEEGKTHDQVPKPSEA